MEGRREFGEQVASLAGKRNSQIFRLNVSETSVIDGV